MKKLMTCLLTSVVLCLTQFSPAFSTSLPLYVLDYLRDKDPEVQVRFDGLILHSNGESYLPVIPFDPAVNPEPQQVVSTLPADKAYPDLIQFDNNFFLIRLVQTASGRVTLPQLSDYPLQLREGLFPQDLVLPSNLFVPAELKILLGELPYNPEFEPSDAPVVPQALKLQQTFDTPEHLTPENMLYLYSLTDKALISVNPQTGKQVGKVDLHCLPAQLATHGRLLFAPCLTTNELVVVDLTAQLVKTRVDVGSRPGHVLVLPGGQQLLVSNRYAKHLNLIDLNNLLPGEKLTLPGPGGVMTAAAAGDSVYIADAFAGKIYQFSKQTKRTLRIFQTAPNISALWLSPPTAQQGSELWAISRTTNKAYIIHPETGQLLDTVDLGKKPTAMGAYNEFLYVIASGENQVDVVDWKRKIRVDAIQLPENSFPTGITISSRDARAYVGGASSNDVFVINLKNNALAQLLPVECRTLALTLTGEPIKINLPQVEQVIRGNLISEDEATSEKASTVLLKNDQHSDTKAKSSSKPSPELEAPEFEDNVVK